MVKKKRKPKGLRICHPDAAGIDIGSNEHWVAVPADSTDNPVRPFGTFTSHLQQLADWLADCGVRTVAMESTGVYWIPLYELLEQRGFEVLLVNAAHARNVPGRKSDVLDCQWLQELHTYGLLRASFRPEAKIAELRTYTRHRQTLIEEAARQIQRMQKSLDQMNVQVHHVLSDLTSKTGMAIVRDIVAGIHDPQRLAQHRDPRCRASLDVIVEALRGHYQPQHLFTLQQALSLFDTYREHLATCDARIQTLLGALACDTPQLDTPPKPPKFKPTGNQIAIDVRNPLQRLLGGVDPLTIVGIGPLTALNLLSETGADMTRWPTEKHFVSWLNFSPGTRITGGKRISGKRPTSTNRASLILRQAASSIGRTRTALGAFYRRIAARRSKAVAVVATARKLACAYYRLLRYGGEYVERGADAAERDYHQRRLSHLERQANSLGFHLQPIESEAGVT
ncbi:MAG: IS110 family transposase [Caldilineaceae bacterium]|jgi:transposase